MDLLKAVNLILPKLGEHPVTTLNRRHSTVALILNELDSQVDNICQSGWWFNEFTTTLPVNTDSEIALPVGTLSFVAHDPFLQPVQRDGKLFNAETLDYKWTKSIEGTVKMAVPFESLPESAAKHAWYSALCSTYVTDIGMGQDLQMWNAAMNAASADMEAEHLVQKKYSTARSRRYQRIRAAHWG